MRPGCIASFCLKSVCMAHNIFAYILSEAALKPGMPSVAAGTAASSLQRVPSSWPNKGSGKSFCRKSQYKNGQPLSSTCWDDSKPKRIEWSVNPQLFFQLWIRKQNLLQVFSIQYLVVVPGRMVSFTHGSTVQGGSSWARRLASMPLLVLVVWAVGRFPSMWKPSVKGRLSHQLMVEAWGLAGMSPKGIMPGVSISICTIILLSLLLKAWIQNSLKAWMITISLMSFLNGFKMIPGRLQVRAVRTLWLQLPCSLQTRNRGHLMRVF